MYRVKSLTILYTIPFFLFIQLVFGANVSITSMDLTSTINSKAELETRGLFELSYDGGYKYQGKLLFQYFNTDLENNTTPALIFDGAQATVRNIFQIFDLTYWTGYYGVLGEGKHYKGHLYHREPGFDYLGYLPILGTGPIISGRYYDISTWQLFIYQRYGSNTVNSLDFVLGLNLEPFIINLFTGVSDSSYRIGTQFQYLGENAEFYLTIGDPTLESGRRIYFDEFYFLMEEWFKVKNWNLILSIFSRPKKHYNSYQRDYVDTNEVNDIDFNFDLNYEPEASYFSGGGELNIQTNRYEQYGVSLSPYISIFTSGITWKVKVDFNVLSQRRDFLTAYLNIKASF